MSRFKPSTSGRCRAPVRPSKEPPSPRRSQQGAGREEPCCGGGGSLGGERARLYGAPISARKKTCLSVEEALDIVFQDSPSEDSDLVTHTGDSNDSDYEPPSPESEEGDDDMASGCPSIMGKMPPRAGGALMLATEG
ncbi:hypothetical protein CesoFtcFv8_015929 [Champsocephalus esox]|uniref:Uncharacterized protein n=1 Tax=Champsocephalus esox TaxID=159716 RepID=A0AAN8BLI1_9TELE|nr:hypothetical protein CesoFtcFv8_015929 [Champsocephalus esox]